MYIVEGYEFESKEMADKAKTEADGIRYIRSQTKLDNPDVVLRLYNKLILKQMFETPVGYRFLNELQEYLRSITYINDRDIRPIPVGSAGGRRPDKEVVRMRKEAQKHAKRMEKVREEFEEKNIRGKRRDYRKAYRVSVAVCAVCVVIIVGMFFITWLSGSNVNIINYENSILDKYESWEQQLEEREAAVSLREKQLKGMQIQGK